MFTLYEKASEQKINCEKSSISFSVCVSDSIKQEICALFGINQTHHAEKYLGLPSIIGRKKNAIFSYIKESMETYKWVE